jgi:hypothetical protein
VHTRCAVAAFVAASLLASCGRAPQTPAYTWTDAVREYQRLVVALGERDPDSIDFFFGDPALAAAVRAQTPPLPEIRRDADALEARVRGLPAPSRIDDVRRRRLLLQVTAVAARVPVVTGANLPFDRESRLLFGVTIGGQGSEARGQGSDDWAAGGWERIREEIARLLPGSGDLADRYDRFDRQFIVPPDRLASVFDKAIDGCRARTVDHLALPRDERVNVEMVVNKPWSAFSRYEGGYRSRIQINADLGWTVDRVLETACHETYPGHHAQALAIDRDLVRGRGWGELAAQPLFSPAAFVSEGSASLAGGLAFPGDDRVRFEREVLFPAAGLDPAPVAKYVQVSRLIDRLTPLQTDIARRYIDGELEFERAAEALRAQTLMAHAEPALKYINEYRSYAITYTYAPTVVSGWLDAQAATAGERWKAYARITDPEVQLQILDRANNGQP